MCSTIKINFYGAFDCQRACAMEGVVPRDADGRVLVAESMIHKVTFGFAAEALACCRAVCLAAEKGWKEIKIEGDSLSIIKKCQSEFQDKLQIETYIQDIRKH